MDTLPKDVLYYITTCLKDDARSLYALSGTCRTLRTQVPKPNIWRFFKDVVVHQSQLNTLSEHYANPRFSIIHKRKTTAWCTHRNIFIVYGLSGLLLTIKESTQHYYIYDWQENLVARVRCVSQIRLPFISTIELTHKQTPIKCTRLPQKPYRIDAIIDGRKLPIVGPRLINGCYYVNFEGRRVISSAHNIRIADIMCFVRNSKSKYRPNFSLDFNASKITPLNAILIAISTFG